MIPRFCLCLFWLAVGAFQLAALADAQRPPCVNGPRPSASLLLPYFEVDLQDRAGITTLLSIGNDSTETQLARLVVWTDWGIPVASFDLVLPPERAVPVNLYDLLTTDPADDGGGDLGPPGGCPNPSNTPSLSATELARRLTGVESPVGSGQCWSSNRGDLMTAVGFLTVDAVSDCPAEPQFPTDEGYFAADGNGLATYDNVLYGDFYLVEQHEDFAQGSALVHLFADPEIIGPGLGRSSFYSFLGSSLPDFDNSDSRYPLPRRYSTRFFNGGAFTGGTSLLAWLPPSNGHQPIACGDPPPPQNGDGGTTSVDWGYWVQSESGANLTPSLQRFSVDAYTSRIDIDGAVVGEATAGTLDLVSLAFCGICSPSPTFERGVVMPLHSAEGRFSVGLEAIVLDDGCPAEAAP